MRRHSDQTISLDELRGRIIGLGEHSSRKSYYPELMERLSELEETKKTLDELNVFLQAVMGSATEVSIIATDPKGIITLFNRGAEKLLGYRAEEMIGRSSAITFHIADEVAAHTAGVNTAYGLSLADFPALVERATREGSDKREWTYVCKDQRHVQVELVITAIHENGQVSGYLGIAKDISERKQAEAKTQQNLKELTALNALAQQIAADISLDKILDVSLAGISEIIRPDLTLFFMRHGDMLELFRSGPVNLPSLHGGPRVHHVGDCLCGLAARTGKPTYSININTDSRCTWEECKKAGIRSFAALPLLVENQVFAVIGLASTVEVDFEKQGSFLEAYSGEIVLGLKNALLIEKVMNHAEELEKEITDRKRVEEELCLHKEHLEELVAERTSELAAANKRLKEVDRLKSMFIASMSHELRTPLNSVIGFSSILLDEWIGVLNDEQKKSLTSILRSGEHLLTLINDVIDVSKIEAGIIEVSSADFDLGELLAEVEQTFAREAERRGLYQNVQQPPITMHTDRRRLLQCLLNLVSNAIKFTERGGITVSVRHEAELNEVTIAVTDTGIGIKAADQGRLFQAFSRIHSPISSKVLGTGLGLYLSKRIINEILHGSISMTSEPGMGSTFSITIPSRLEENK